MILLNQNVFRPAIAPSANLPFGVRSAGHHRLRHPYAGRDKIINFVQLFWCANGACKIEIDAQPRTLKKYHVALLFPNMRHYHFSDNEDVELHWFTLDGPFAVSITAAFGLEAGIYQAGPPPAALFRDLLRLVGQPSKPAEQQACATAFTILTKAAGAHPEQTDELIRNAVKYLHEHNSSPTLNIKTLAASLGIRRANFYTRFQAVVGLAPGAYLNRVRVQKAISLLQRTRRTISEVALECGYTDANYFSRAFRRSTGRSPLQFRQAPEIAGKQGG